ncbi:MAG: hypothetical protein HOQ28_12680 [Thermoleophilia bacterium]|nr:hypothetical protein [Thermoleophilia bacterium]
MDVELARQQWRDGNRRVEDTRGNHARYVQLTGQVDVVVAGLRRRVGQVFTLAELVEAYGGADDWARELLEEADPEGPPPAEPGTVADAAFHVYARGATDYRP